MSTSEVKLPAVPAPTLAIDASATACHEADSYTVAVRALCEFTAKAGDLDPCFTPSPPAQDAIAGHNLVASR